MRLPAITAAQIGNEDAREFHEDLWDAFLRVEPVIVPIGHEQAGTVMKRLASNHKNFWQRRGYRMRQAQTEDKTGVRVWLEALTPKTTEAA